MVADAPLHYWRIADPPGSYLWQNIGTIGAFGQFATPATASAPLSGFSGPVSDGGAAFFSYGSFGQGPVFSHAIPLTLECWIWFLPEVTGNRIAFAWNYDSNSVGIGLSGTNQPQLWGGGGTNVQGGATLSSYTWHHLVGVYQAGATHLYVDGALTGSGSGPTGSPYNNIQAWLARTNANGQLFAGLISEVAFYPSALSAARALAHFNAADQKTAPPVYGAASGLQGLPTNSAYTDLLQQILQSVRKTFVDL